MENVEKGDDEPKSIAEETTCALLRLEIRNDTVAPLSLSSSWIVYIHASKLS